jgi:microcystin degradation protein MlrC
MRCGLRVGVAGLSCECCTFSPAITTEDDFVVVRGEALLKDYSFRADHPNVEFVPLLRARALPGGPIDTRFYKAVKKQLLGELALGGPWNGLLLHMHGAANVVGLDDAEGDLLAATREVVGSECLIAASYDLHGNVSPQVMRNLDILTAYRTAPHVDADETMKRACALLIRSLESEWAPTKAFIPVPILLPGEQTSTEWEPAAGLYAAIPEVVERLGILDASILIGYPWADEPRAGASVVACGLAPHPTHEAARQLAQRLWDARNQFHFGTESGPVDECLRLAAASPVRPVFVSDSGDNPTAGGAGDVPYVLGRLLAMGASSALYVSIADPEAISHCLRVGIGVETEVSLGGKLDPLHGSPLTLRVRVLAIHPSVERANTSVVLEVGGIHVIVTERRTPFHRLEDFVRIGLDPRRYQVVIVKIGYLEPELKRLARRSLLALSPGAVNQDLGSRPFERIRRPMYPLDSDAEWEPPARRSV